MIGGARAAGLPLVLLALACRGAGERGAGAPLPPPPGGAIPAAQTPQLQALGAALADGDDALATLLLERLEGGPASADERAFLAACRRILTGRELGRAIQVELAGEGGQAPGEELALALTFLQTTGAPLVLLLPPADLEEQRTWIDEHGLENRSLAVRGTGGFERLLLPSGVPRRVELGTVATEIEGALAVRGVWRVAFRSGEVERDGQRYPVRTLAAPRFERTRLIAGLEPSPADPRELVRALADPARELGGVLALAVRVPSEGRADALRALAPEVERLAREAPERLRRCASALRWLARTSDPGTDPARWAAWFRDFGVRDAERERAGSDARLDLPRPSGR